jgi:hypothetical protein
MQVGTSSLVAPTLLNFTVSPRMVQTLHAAASVSVTFTLAYTSISSCTAYFNAPSGSGAATLSVQGVPPATPNIVNNTIQFTVNLTVPQYSAAGLWPLSSLYCYPSIGSSVSYSSSQLMNYLINPPFGFIQSDPGDIQPPVITAASILPSSYDSSQSSQNVVLSVMFTDDLSGLSICTANFLNPISALNSLYMSSSADAISAGTLLNGTIILSVCGT